MSLADVSKSMGDLAAAINKKNSELEQLKHEYQEKLRLIDLYLKKLHDAASSMSNPEELTSRLADVIVCPNCKNTLYDLYKDSEYVLVPKKQLFIVNDCDDTQVFKKEESLERELQKLNMNGPKSESVPASPYQHRNTSKSKRTCSYCNKTGHSRARCFARLSKDPGTDV